MKVEKRIKRLSVNLTEKEHQKLKILATKRNTTITKIVLQALLFYSEKIDPKIN